MSVNGPSDTTVRRLFAVSMNCCAFPECTTPIIDPTARTVLAEICHIHARSPRGPRYNPAQSDEDRHGFDNLILMCGVHHKLIDAPENLLRFPPEVLNTIKAEHEGRARAAHTAPPSLSEELLNVLQSAGESYEAGATKNDFRQAVFRVGGEGGHWGGGGGGGGILTIVGSRRAPADVALKGQEGQAPGAGGGGGGAVQCIGRSVDSDDLAKGLRLSSMLLANAASLSGPLVNLLGAGWTYLLLPAIPQKVWTWLAFTIELGDIEPSTLLRLTVRVIDPNGRVASESIADVEVPISSDLIKRVSLAKPLELEVAVAGLWTVAIASSTHLLGEHHFECRLQV